MDEIHPIVSVVVCHHTGRNLLTRCLESVWRAQNVLEVIVVTSDPTYLGDPKLTLLFLEDGPAAKRNLGVQHAHAEYIVFLDDDVEVDPACFREFVNFFTRHSYAGMLFAKIYKMEEGRRDEFDDCGSWITPSGFLYARAGAGTHDAGQYDTPTRCLASKSATCAIRASTFAQVGGFDPTYYILGEETDLAWRVWLSGLEVWYVPTAISWHAFGCPTLKPKQEFYTDERIFTRGCKNYLSLLWTHLSYGKRIQILPLHLSAWLLATLGFLCRGDWPKALSVMRGLRDFARSLPHLQRTRRAIQSSRVRSDADLWPLVSYSPPLSYYATRLWRYWTTQLHG